MQNKGLIRFLAWAFALACLWQLSFTLVTSSVERKAKAQAKTYAASEEVNQMLADRQVSGIAAQNLRDSIQNAKEDEILAGRAGDKVYFGYTYRQCQEREIGLGLDLKGGMNVMLEVSTVDVVRALADHTEDPVFNQAIDKALAAQKTTTNRDFVTLFYDAITSIKADVKLAPYFHGQMRDKIKLTDDNSAVVAALRAETTDAYERTYQVLSQRIDKFGVAQPSIQKLSASERILVELPGVKDPTRVRKLLQGTAQLEFWLTYMNDEFQPNLIDLDRYIASIGGAAEVKEAAEDTLSQLDKLSNVEQQRDNVSANPLFSLLQPMQYAKTPVVGYAKVSDTAAVAAMLRKGFDHKIFDSRTVKLLWDAKADAQVSKQAGADMVALYAIKITTRDGSPLLDGSCISDARQDFTPEGDNEISMTMTSEGARDWRRITGENIGNCVAIVLDDYVYSAPTVQSEIAGGRSQITGNFSLEEAKDLANILKSGKLPAPANIASEAVVGPSLGQESIRKGLWSFILAFVVVLIYMVIFYNRAGWVSVAALLVNVFLLVGVLASIGTVLTLPGIAGIVLTMAMAVDGNVIIYERIKEELRNGATMANAVQQGFKNAYSAIIDGQVTTFLLGVVLIIFGSGAVQGFAVTLCVGIVTSLFTSIFITRLIIDSRLNHKRKMSFSFPFSENFLRNAHVDFIGKRKTFYIIACVAILVSVGGWALLGLNRGIDFTGGRTYVIRFDQDVKVSDVRASLNDKFDRAPEVKTYGPSNQVKVTTQYLIDQDGDEVKNQIVGLLYDGTSQFFKTPISLHDFSSTDTNPLGIIQADQVGGTIAHDNLMRSIWAVIGGLIVMFVYIGIRFRSWRFGIGSVAALAHDTLLIIGVFALLKGILPFNLDVDQYFITAVLTIIGYSINATVVIFDRVRENKTLYPKRDLKSQMNDAINATLARTVNTSGTTFVTLFAMFCLGGEVIRGFVFALLTGIVVGFFSSLCIACSVVYEVSKKESAVVKA